MSDATEQTTSMQTQSEQQFDPSKLACRVVDVHAALQNAFVTFSQSGENSLEALARTIESNLGEIPAFLIGEVAETPLEIPDTKSE